MMRMSFLDVLVVALAGAATISTAEAEPAPLPLEDVQAPYAATPATSSPVTATATRR